MVGGAVRHVWVVHRLRLDGERGFHGRWLGHFDPDRRVRHVFWVEMFRRSYCRLPPPAAGGKTEPPDLQDICVISLQLAAPSLFSCGVLLGVHMCFCYFVCGWRFREFRRETRMPFGPQVAVLYSDRLFLGQLHVQSPPRSATPAPEDALIRSGGLREEQRRSPNVG